MTTRPVRLHKRHNPTQGNAIVDIPDVPLEKLTGSVRHDGVVYDFWYTSNSSRYPKQRLQHYVERSDQITDLP